MGESAYLFLNFLLPQIYPDLPKRILLKTKPSCICSFYPADFRRFTQKNLLENNKEEFICAFVANHYPRRRVSPHFIPQTFPEIFRKVPRISARSAGEISNTTKTYYNSAKIFKNRTARVHISMRSARKTPFPSLPFPHL